MCTKARTKLVANLRRLHLPRLPTLEPSFSRLIQKPSQIKASTIPFQPQLEILRISLQRERLNRNVRLHIGCLVIIRVHAVKVRIHAVEGVISVFVQR